MRTGGRTHVELVGLEPTVHGISALVRAIARDASGAAWRVDGRSGAQTLVERALAERAGLGDETPPLDIGVVRVSDVTTYAQGFLDAVREGTVEWYRPPAAGDGEDEPEPDALTESVLTVTRRRIGNMGGWGFGGDNPTAAEAAAIARWAAQAAPDESDEMEVFYG